MKSIDYSFVSRSIMKNRSRLKIGYSRYGWQLRFSSDANACNQISRWIRTRLRSRRSRLSWSKFGTTTACIITHDNFECSASNWHCLVFIRLCRRWRTAGRKSSILKDRHARWSSWWTRLTSSLRQVPPRAKWTEQHRLVRTEVEIS